MDISGHATSAGWQLAKELLTAVMQPIFVIDVKSKLYFENPPAKIILQQEQVFGRWFGRVVACDPEQRSRLADFIRQLGSAEPGAILGPHTIQAKQCETPYLAFLAVIDFSSVLPKAGAAGLLMLFGCEDSQFDGAAFRNVFGLSQAEERVVSLLVAGHSVAAAAGKLKIAVATARTHLKSIFRKTGVNRQKDLVRLATQPVFASGAGRLRDCAVPTEKQKRRPGS